MQLDRGVDAKKRPKSFSIQSDKPRIGIKIIVGVKTDERRKVWKRESFHYIYMIGRPRESRAFLAVHSCAGQTAVFGDIRCVFATNSPTVIQISKLNSCSSDK